MKEKVVAQYQRKGAVAIVAAFFLVSAALIGKGALSRTFDPPQKVQQTASKSKVSTSTRPRVVSTPLSSRAIRREIMWSEPADVASRDLFYGIGGRKGAPDPSTPFTYVKRSTSGTQKKIIVKDALGREWTVKFGREARPETSASRIVWAVGYHTDQDYFVRRARIVGQENIDARDVRFERRNDGFKEDGKWSWKENPFVGTRDLDGLKILMALLKNWDVKTDNNEIARVKGKEDVGTRIYYVSDLGASLGRTGTFLNHIPFFADLPAEKGFSPGKSKGDPEAFADEKFIDGVKDGKVEFHYRRSRGRSMVKGIPVSSARWMGALLGRLSDKQLSDAFRAGGFDDMETAQYVRVMRQRINQLRRL
jgi:hypothetical protein